MKVWADFSMRWLLEDFILMMTPYLDAKKRLLVRVL
jgi:hypothetical protein